MPDRPQEAFARPNSDNCSYKFGRRPNERLSRRGCRLAGATASEGPWPPAALPIPPRPTGDPRQKKGANGGNMVSPSLDAEGGLDLVQRGEPDQNGEEGEDRQNDPEAGVRTTRVLPVCTAGPATGALPAVGPLDRGWVEGGRLLDVPQSSSTGKWLAGWAIAQAYLPQWWSKPSGCPTRASFAPPRNSRRRESTCARRSSCSRAPLRRRSGPTWRSCGCSTRRPGSWSPGPSRPWIHRVRPSCRAPASRPARTGRNRSSCPPSSTSSSPVRSSSAATVGDFDASARALAELAAAQLGIALRTFPRAGRPPAGDRGPGCAVRRARAGRPVAGRGRRSRARGTTGDARSPPRPPGARAVAIWRIAGARLELVTRQGDWSRASLEQARAVAAQAVTSWEPVIVEDPAGPGRWSRSGSGSSRSACSSSAASTSRRRTTSPPCRPSPHASRTR